MFIHYLRSAFRCWFKNKTISLINLAGPVAGMTVFLIIIQYVVFERSYDRFHANKENIFRVESRFFKNGIMTDDWSTSSGGYGPAMAREFPAIQNVAKIYLKANERVVSHQDVKHREKNVYFADNALLDIFSFDLMREMERRPWQSHTIIISESAGKKYFTSENAAGKTLKLGNNSAVFECTVTGMFADIPQNSHDVSICLFPGPPCRPGVEASMNTGTSIPST